MTDSDRVLDVGTVVDGGAACVPNRRPIQGKVERRTPVENVRRACEVVSPIRYQTKSFVPGVVVAGVLVPAPLISW